MNRLREHSFPELKKLPNALDYKERFNRRPVRGTVWKDEKEDGSLWIAVQASVGVFWFPFRMVYVDGFRAEANGQQQPLTPEQLEFYD